jgi:hypothetical protein
MKPQTPAEMHIPTGFDGPVNVARVNADLIFDATIAEWTDHGIVIVYVTNFGTRLRSFIPFTALTSISSVISQQEEV